MADYTIDKGTPNWDVPLNADLTDIDNRLTINESTITGVQTTVNNQGTQITSLQGSVASNSADIATNTGNINGLTTSLATTNSNVATNTSNIATNTANIATNTANISTNTTNITNAQNAINSVGTVANAAVPKDTLVVNVKDHGAVGDGVADDRTAIVNALAVVGSAGGTLYFPPGAYLVNSGTAIVVSNSIQIAGAGAGASSVWIGSSFTGSALFSVTQSDVTFRDIQIRGASTTTTSNPVADGISASGVQTFKVINCTLQWINGYAIKAFGTASVTLHGGQILDSKIQSCAGGVYIKSDNTATAANFEISNLFTRFLGVTSGGSANLDGIRIEDSWDVLVQNCFAWMNATTGGTGVAFRIVGNCAATFVLNLDALGPQTGAANVSIEGNANGSPQNVQITGGVIQQGTVGLNIQDAATQVRVASVRFINNQTHGATISTSGPAVYLDSVFFSGNGNGATGTNYDLNWTGTTTGFVTNCRFASPIVSTGTAGVQASVNITAGRNVRFFNSDFQGTGNAIANWFTGLPTYATTNSAVVAGDTTGRFAFLTDVNFSYTTGPGRVSIQPNAAGNNCLSLNVQGTDVNDRFRLLGNGNQQFGPGTAGRDTTWGRTGTAQIGTIDSDIAITAAGKSLKVASGTNAKAGTVTANGTTAVTVSTTAITANSAIILSYKSGTQAAGGTAWVSALTAGTSFQIKSLSGDTAVYNWVAVDVI